MSRCCGLGLAATLLAALLGTAFSSSQYYIYNQYLYSSQCGKQAQRQSGTRYGACVSQSSTHSSQYQLISYDSATNTAQYNYTTFTNSNCEGTGVTTLGTTSAACEQGNPGASFYFSYAKGVTPWTQSLSAGGLVTLYWYNQDPSDPCQGPPDSYYASGYDNCNSIADGTSSRTVTCASSTYEVDSYSDDACSFYRKSSTLPRSKCAPIAGTTSYSTTVCALASENFVLSADAVGEDKDSKLPGVGIILSVLALLLSAAALGLWSCILCSPSKRTAEHADGSATESLLRG